MKETVMPTLSILVPQMHVKTVTRKKKEIKN